MTGRITHVLFSVVPPTDYADDGAMIVTCTCGLSSYCSTIRAALDWFGGHCFNAALDRAIELLRS